MPSQPRTALDELFYTIPVLAAQEAVYSFDYRPGGRYGNTAAGMASKMSMPYICGTLSVELQCDESRGSLAGIHERMSSSTGNPGDVSRFLLNLCTSFTVRFAAQFEVGDRNN